MTTPFQKVELAVENVAQFLINDFKQAVVVAEDTFKNFLSSPPNKSMTADIKSILVDFLESLVNEGFTIIEKDAGPHSLPVVTSLEKLVDGYMTSLVVKPPVIPQLPVDPLPALIAENS